MDRQGHWIQKMVNHENTAKYCRKPDFLSVEMDGELVMMSIESGDYFGTSGAGPFIWELLEYPHNISELTDAVCAEFDVDNATAREHIEGYIAELSEQGIVEIS